VTGDYGKIVLGSWFGSKSVLLKNLGGRFHRSHMTIVASQVSSIPAQLSGRWSKGRRFQVVWNAVRQLKPSLLITSIARPLEASSVYAGLDTNPSQELQVVFYYGK